MQPVNRVSERGIDLIKSFEGLSLEAYPDPVSKGDPWTIGWGHTGRDVYPGHVISHAEAEALLTADIRHCVLGIDKLCRVPLNQNQFDALVSFTFNTGLAAFAGSSMLRHLNLFGYEGAADEFPRWDKGHRNGQVVVVPELQERRAIERALFLEIPHGE